MSYQCRMCGEAVDVPEGMATVKCPHCGTVQAVLRSDEDTFTLGEKRTGGSGSGNKKLMGFFAAAILLLAIGVLSWNAARIPQQEPGGINMGVVRGQPTGTVSNTITSLNYKEMAEQGDPEAQYHVGEMYFKGDGVTRDVRQAAKWYLRAAEQGYVDAQNKLGVAYYNGWGVERDYKEAVKWYQRAATRDNDEAQVALGNMYYNGTGVVKSYVNAVWWYEQAASQGNAWAQYYLGNMYRNGLGVDKDISRARDLYQQAAQSGHLAAMAALQHTKKLK